MGEGSEQATTNNSLPVSLLEQLLKSGQYHDFVIECEGQEFKVHRAVVCTASPTLSKLCNSPFKEGTSGRGNLGETKPETFQRALRFIYTAVYSIADSEETVTVEEALLRHVELYVLADFLQIAMLKAESLDHCIQVLSNLSMTDMKLPELYNAIAYAFNRTSKEDYPLRKPILQACAKAYHSIKQTELEELLFEEEALAWELAKDSRFEYNELVKSHTAGMEMVNSFAAKVQSLVNSQKWLCGQCGASVALILDKNTYSFVKGPSYCHCKDIRSVAPLSDRHKEIQI